MINMRLKARLQQDAREKLDAKLTKIIDDLFILWKKTMYPGIDKYFADNELVAYHLEYLVNEISRRAENLKD